MTEGSEDDTREVSPAASEPEHTAAPRAIGVGDSVGPYRVLEELGRGGMGVVFAAHDPRLDRRVAIKLVHARRSQPKAAARMLREGKALARLSHPNVVPVFDVGVIGDAATQVFIAMELVEGRTLSRWLKSAPSWSAVLDVLVQCAHGLAAAHTEGLVHRDFKPANVMIGEDGRARVLDFGLARADETVSRPTDPESEGDRSEPSPRLRHETGSDSRSGALSAEAPLTDAGAVMGTPPYMAPEQHVGGHLDARTDQFAWCVAAYEALFGVRPFAGNDAMALYEAKLGRSTTPPDSSAQAPRWLLPILERGLEPNAGDRWSSLDALVDAIEGARSRGRRVVPVTVLGLSIVALGAWAWMDRPPAVDCTAQAADALAAVYDDDTKAAVEQAFAASDMGFVASSRDRVLERLDGYGRDWSALRESACQLGLDTPEDETLDRRLACLSERRAALGGTAERIAALDATGLERAVMLVGSLPPLSGCIDTEVLAAAVPPPEDGPTRRAVDRIRQQLARLETGGKADEARVAAIDAIVEDAVATGYAPIVAEARLKRGVALEQWPDPQVSLKAMDEAYEAAVTAGDDALAARAASRMAFVNAQRLSNVDEAKRWADSATSLVDRLPAEYAACSVVFAAVATVYTVAGEYERADALYERAIAAEQARGTRGSASTLMSRGDNLRRMGKFAEAEAAQRRAVEIDREILGPNHPSLGMSLGSLGVAVRMQGRDEEAEPLLKECVDVLERAYGPDHPRVGMALGNYANLFHSRGDTERYIELTTRALEIFRKTLGPTHEATAMATDNLAMAKNDEGDHQGALELMRETLDVRREAFGDVHVDVARSHMGIGLALAGLQRNDEAREAWKTAEETMLAAGGEEHPVLAQMRASIGDELLELGDVDDAVRALEGAVTRCAGEGIRPDLCAGARLSLAEALARQGSDITRARELANEARAFYEESKNADKLAETERWLEQHGA